MRKFLFSFFILFSGYYAAFSQQEAQITHYMFNQPFYNPGSYGSNDMICATLIARQQWLGFKDENGNNISPRTFLLNVDAPVKILRGGIGLTIFNDKLGFENNIGVKLGYAYRLSLGPGKLGIGLQLSLLNKFQDFSKLTFTDIYEPLVQNKNKQTIFLTDIAGGVYYNIPDKMYAGISATQLIQSDKKYSNLADLKLKRHYYFSGGYYFAIPNNEAFVINPSVFIKTDFVSAQYDFNATLIYNSKFWGGLGYRVNDAIMLLVGFNIKNILVGYSYGFTTSAIGRQHTYGDHELVLRYAFKLEQQKARKSYKNARYI
jgi:type IX secretion system PorP/SprF family membrane protein